MRSITVWVGAIVFTIGAGVFLIEREYISGDKAARARLEQGKLQLERFDEDGLRKGIDDLTAVVVKALDGTGQGVYHISSGADYSIKELFDATIGVLGIKLAQPVEVRPRLPDDVYTILIDPSRTNRDFGWKASTPLEYGVRKAIDYYREFGISQTFTHLKQVEEAPAKKHAA